MIPYLPSFCQPQRGYEMGVLLSGDALTIGVFVIVSAAVMFGLVCVVVAVDWLLATTYRERLTVVSKGIRVHWGEEFPFVVVDAGNGDKQQCDVPRSVYDNVGIGTGLDFLVVRGVSVVDVIRLAN